MRSASNLPLTAMVSVAALLQHGFLDVHAAELDVEFRAGATYSDNVTRAEEVTIDETIAFGGLSLDWTQRSRRINFELQANADYNHYVDDTFDDEVVGAATGDLEFGLVPERVFWAVSNRFGTLQTDPLNADTADNRGNYNVFTTGPRIVLPIGSRTSLTLEGAYTDNWFEERETDNDLVSGTLSLSRALSQVRSVSLLASYEDADFDDDVLNQDYERASASLDFQSEVSKGSLSASLGYNEIRILDETLDGVVAGLSFSRELTTRTTLRLSYDQQYSSSGDVFRSFNNPGVDFGETIDQADDGEPFERRLAAAVLAFDSGKSTISLRIALESQEYESDSELERENTIVRLGLGRELGAGWSVSLDGQFRRGDYANISRVDDDTTAGLRIGRQLTRTVVLDLGYEYADRSSDTAGRNYRENRYTLTLRFNPE